MFETSLISPDNTWALWSILIGIAALAIYLEQNYAWASKLTGAIIGLLGAMILSNIGVIPVDAPTYDNVWNYVVPLAIPLLMFETNLKKIWKESGRILAMFMLGAVGTLLGVFVSFFLLQNAIPDLYKMAAMMTGSYIGGGVNFAAMAESFGAGEAWISALTVADNLLMALYFFVLLAIPSMKWFLNKFRHPHIDEVDAQGSDSSKTKAAQYWKRKDISLRDIAFAIAIAFIIVWISTEIADFFAALIQPTNFLTELLNGLLGNKYLMITTLTMGLATFAPKFMSSINGAQEIGTFLIYIFLVVIGVPASIPIIISQAPLLLVFTFIIVAINMIISFILGKLFKFDLEEILLCSNANIGGPTTAAAMAIAKGWTKLVGPIILAGTWGYVIGNYLGIFMGNLLGRF